MSILMQLNEALSKRDQAKLMKEWREVSAELTVFALISKKMATRVSEIEKTLLPIVKEADNQKEVISNAILEYTHSEGKRSVSYSDLWNETLKTVTEDQKMVLEQYKKAIEKVGKGSEGLKICDPKLEKIIAGIRSDMTVAELKQVLVEIVKLPDDVDELTEGSILDIIKRAIRFISDAFKSVGAAQKKALFSVGKLADLASKSE